MIFEDPLNYLRQIKWFLDNIELEQFPGAFVIAAGHLCRCVVEQEYVIVGALTNLSTDKILDTVEIEGLNPFGKYKEFSTSPLGRTVPMEIVGRPQRREDLELESMLI